MSGLLKWQKQKTELTFKPLSMHISLMVFNLECLYGFYVYYTDSKYLEAL